MKQKRSYFLSALSFKGPWTIVPLFLLLVLFFFSFRAFYNEMDVIPYARSVFDPSWLKDDWYLGLKIPYRFVFSYPVGFFADQFGFIKTIVFGRLISYFLMAISLASLIRSLKINSYQYLFFLPLVVFFKYFRYGMGAGEWMIGGLETKVFAYGFLLLSLAGFLNRDYKRALIFAGLTLSFHVLIGAFHLICIIPIILFHQKTDSSSFSRVIRLLPMFLLSGAVGIYGIVYQFFLVEKEMSNLGWEVYVNISVAHHVLPTSFPFRFWIFLPVLTLANLALVFRVEDQRVRQLSLYALFTVLISLVGLAIFFYFGPTHYLKYYFFRSSDILLPLLTILNLTTIIIKQIDKSSLKVKANVKYAFLIGFLLMTLPRVRYFLSTFTLDMQGARKKYIVSDPVMEQWVKENTGTDKTFITSPDDIFFYFKYERPMFVSIRHSPQNGEDMIEWYDRLKALNAGQKVTGKQEVTENYSSLTTQQVLQISRRYPKVAYILMPRSAVLDLPVLFETKATTLYEIPGKIG